LPITLYFDNER